MTILRMMISVSVLALVSGCASIDPLGSPAKNPETGQADYPTRGGIICREIMGGLEGVEYVNAQGQGFRCLDVGEQSIEGCVTYDDGRFSYKSAGCSGD